MASPTTTSESKPGLARVLGLWSLVIYGIVLIQPTASWTRSSVCVAAGG